jgi:hypothetical protein
MTVFIQKGDAPMSVRQATKRGLRHFNTEKAQWQREQGIVESDPEYQAWAEGWIADNVVNGLNNLFNHQLADYRKAVARLEQYKVAEGRPEITEEQPTGEYDEEGNEITETVVLQTAIDPVEPTVEQPVYDDEGNQTGTETVTNPLIVQDEAERSAAQSVIDNTPQEVADYANP